MRELRFFLGVFFFFFFLKPHTSPRELEISGQSTERDSALSIFIRVSLGDLWKPGLGKASGTECNARTVFFREQNGYYSSTRWGCWGLRVVGGLKGSLRSTHAGVWADWGFVNINSRGFIILDGRNVDEAGFPPQKEVQIFGNFAEKPPAYEIRELL